MILFFFCYRKRQTRPSELLLYVVFHLLAYCFLVIFPVCKELQIFLLQRSSTNFNSSDLSPLDHFPFVEKKGFSVRLVRTKTVLQIRISLLRIILFLLSIHLASSLICYQQVTYTEKTLNKFFTVMPCCLPERLQLQILAIDRGSSIFFPGISHIICCL